MVTCEATTPADPVTLEQLVAEYRTDPRPDVLEKIVEASEPLVQGVARRTRWHVEPLDDLAQVARVGLLGAVERYDPARGASFHTYAQIVMTGMIRHHHRTMLQVKVPRSAQDLHTAYRTTADRLTATLQRAPTSAELAAAMGVPEAEVVDAMAIDQLFHPLSLSATITNDSDLRLEDCIGGGDSRIDATADRAAVHEALTALPSRERAILFHRFFEGRTQAEIGAQLGISQVHVSRLMAKALASMREHVASRQGADVEPVSVQLAS